MPAKSTGPDKQEEKFDSKDIIQIAVGSFAGALTYAYQTDVARLGSQLTAFHVILIVVISIILAFLVSYKIGIRDLGKKKMKIFLGFIPVRVAVHYLTAIFFSIIVLYMLGTITPDITFSIFVKRVLVLSLPASVFGSAVDLIGSQKEKG
jgi:uncharacterized membrane protein